MVKRFGPTRGAGTVIAEQEGSKTIQPGALGWAGMAGVLERGDVGKLMLISSKAELFARTGGIIPDSFLPDCAQDYFSLANGAGGLALVRVTDGNEKQASSVLYARVASVLTPMGILKAANGGRWGGRQRHISEDLDDVEAHLANTTLQLPGPIDTDFATDELKGGYIELFDVPNARFPIIGNSDMGLVTVASDQTMLDKYDALSGTSPRFFITLENEGKAVSFRITDGEDSPDSEFAIEVFVDGASVRKWGNLHTSPLNARYWVNVINSDESNYYVVAEDLWTGAHTASVRPATHYGVIATVTATVMTARVFDFQIESPTGGNPTLEVDAVEGQLSDTLTITMSSATAGAVVSERFGALGVLTLGTEFEIENRWIPEFTVTAGGTPLAAGNVLTIHFKPFKKDALVGGFLYPDKVNSKLVAYRIVSNTFNTITVAAGSTLTSEGETSGEFMVVAALEMEGGADGNADVIDASYEQQAWDVDLSPFNDIEGENIGLVKFSTPGITSTAVQKAGAAYAEGKNHQYRYEAPANVTTEQGIVSLINDTLGRSDYAVIAWPSYGYVPDPDPAFAREGRLKLIPLTGAIHGREARIAADFDGYHKAEAGVDATLPRVLKVPTLDRRLNEELLNPTGIAVIKKKSGNFVIWGDRTLHRDSAWRWKHQREQMSYYEHVLEQAFDFIIFSINDRLSDKIAETALNTFFKPEFVKRALRGKTYGEAVTIKVDDEINTDQTRADGNKFAEVTLQLADTVERFVIKIGKQGIFESVA